MVKLPDEDDPLVRDTLDDEWVKLIDFWNLAGSRLQHDRLNYG